MFVPASEWTIIYESATRVTRLRLYNTRISATVDRYVANTSYVRVYIDMNQIVYGNTTKDPDSAMLTADEWVAEFIRDLQ